MIDRGKVIKGLECCLNGPMQCNKCPYKGDDGTTVPTCVKTLRSEAIELLKQEPMQMKIAMDYGSLKIELLKKPDAYEVLDSISSAYYGKQLYFLQDNGMIYDRKECDYVPFEEALNRFVKMVGED